MSSARDQLNVINAYRKVGTHRRAAGMCGIDHKTAKRIIEKNTGQPAGRRHRPVGRAGNHEVVRPLVAAKVAKTLAKITAKRLMAEVWAAGYAGSDRNLRRLVREEKLAWRKARSAGRQQRRPAVWAPGEYWSSTGTCSAGCTCSARCWRSPGSGSCGSPTTNAPTPPWRCWRSDSRPSVGSRRSCSRTEWGPERRGRRGRGEPHPRPSPVRHALLLQA